MITMDNSSDPFKSIVDQSIPLLSHYQDDRACEQSSAGAHPGRFDMNSAPSPDGPPVYQYPFFTDNKNHAVPVVAQPSVLPAPIPPILNSIHATPAATEAEWYDTLRELQANMADLRTARTRISRYSALARMAPRGFRSSTGTKDVEREMHVLEELVLAGMRRLARIHSDPIVQAEWVGRADEFSRSLRSPNVEGQEEGIVTLDGAEGAVSNELGGARAQRFKRRAARFLLNETDSPLVGLSKGFCVILATPVILAGAAVFSAGAVLYGSGKIVIGFGHIVTCGKFR